MENIRQRWKMEGRKSYPAPGDSWERLCVWKLNVRKLLNKLGHWLFSFIATRSSATGFGSKRIKAQTGIEESE